MMSDLWGDPEREASQIDRHVGQRIKLRRRALNLTQQDVAKALQIDAKEVAMLEVGVRRASAGTLFVLCNLMDVTAEWFFRGFGATPCEAPKEDEPGPEEGPRHCEQLVELLHATNDEDLCLQVLQFARSLLKRNELGEVQQNRGANC